MDRQITPDRFGKLSTEIAESGVFAEISVHALRLYAAMVANTDGRTMICRASRQKLARCGAVKTQRAFSIRTRELAAAGLIEPLEDKPGKPREFLIKSAPVAAPLFSGMMNALNVSNDQPPARGAGGGKNRPPARCAQGPPRAHEHDPPRAARRGISEVQRNSQKAAPGTPAAPKPGRNGEHPSGSTDETQSAGGGCLPDLILIGIGEPERSKLAKAVDAAGIGAKVKLIVQRATERHVTAGAVVLDIRDALAKHAAQANTAALRAKAEEAAEALRIERQAATKQDADTFREKCELAHAFCRDMAEDSPEQFEAVVKSALESMPDKKAQFARKAMKQAGNALSVRAIVLAVYEREGPR